MSSILNNVAALTATRQLNITSAGMEKTIKRLTTGKRINNAADDATGLKQAEEFRGDAKVAAELKKLANSSYYSEQAKDGYLQEATDLVQRAIELGAGGNSSSSEMSSTSTLALAAAAKAGVTLSAINNTETASTALATLATNRATIASNMATAQSNANLYGIEQENKTAQQSNIMDADIGSEVVQLTKWQILSQSGTSALSSANQASQYVLGLLR